MLGGSESQGREVEVETTLLGTQESLLLLQGRAAQPGGSVQGAGVRPALPSAHCTTKGSLTSVCLILPQKGTVCIRMHTCIPTQEEFQGSCVATDPRVFVLSNSKTFSFPFQAVHPLGLTSLFGHLPQR